MERFGDIDICHKIGDPREDQSFRTEMFTKVTKVAVFGRIRPGYGFVQGLHGL